MTEPHARESARTFVSSAGANLWSAWGWLVVSAVPLALFFKAQFQPCTNGDNSAGTPQCFVNGNDTAHGFFPVVSDGMARGFVVAVAALVIVAVLCLARGRRREAWWVTAVAIVLPIAVYGVGATHLWYPSYNG